MSKTIVGVFNNFSEAEKAANQVKDRGLRTDDISIVTKQGEEHIKENNVDTTATMGVNNNTAAMGPRGETRNDNVSDGVVTGGILGGLAGLLIGAGSMMIPGLGIIAAAGPITGLLSGAVTGGIVGGLVDLGIPENKSRQYEGEIKSGRVLFSMRTDEDKVDNISAILKDNGALSVDAY
ncbi:MAG: hypothetical protein K0R31_220 [Clostridiales bacterium]|nr:hypothetical protein [Clostridiales bacterium]